MTQGGDSFIRSASKGSAARASHFFSFSVTHGFCVHRSLEKYALMACRFDKGCP